MVVSIMGFLALSVVRLGVLWPWVFWGWSVAEMDSEKTKRLGINTIDSLKLMSISISTVGHTINFIAEIASFTKVSIFVPTGYLKHTTEKLFYSQVAVDLLSKRLGYRRTWQIRILRKHCTLKIFFRKWKPCFNAFWII